VSQITRVIAAPLPSSFGKMMTGAKSLNFDRHFNLRRSRLVTPVDEAVFQWLGTHSPFQFDSRSSQLSRRLRLPLSSKRRFAHGLAPELTSARNFTHFTCPVIPAAPYSAEAALPSLGPSAMSDLNGPDGLGVRERTPVDEELWSLKVVIAKTGLSRSTLYRSRSVSYSTTVG
jgi:hypothetical protein